MATSPDDDMYGDLEGAMDAANARAVQEQFDANEALNQAKAPRLSKRESLAPAAKEVVKTSVKESPNSVETNKTVTRNQTSPATDGIAQYAATRKNFGAFGEAPLAKTDTYRTLSGEIKNKAADTSEADRAANRESLFNSLKGAASSVGDYFSDLGKREKKTGTYVRDGKVVRYAKGGMTKSSSFKQAPKVSSASKRADGCAVKGKTKGRYL